MSLPPITQSLLSYTTDACLVLGEKLALANKAMLAKDYKLAIEMANQAQADAKLAQSKASSVKAQAAADVLQDDIRVLREELNRPR